MLQDLTARTAAELALARSERALKLVLDNAPLLVSHINPDGVFTFCNVTHARWLQRTPEEVCGQMPERVFTPGTYALLAPYMVRAQRGESVEFEITAPWYESRTPPARATALDISAASSSPTPQKHMTAAVAFTPSCRT